MRTTVTLDETVLAKATALIGALDRSALLEEGLKALIERESAMRLAQATTRGGGTVGIRA